MNSDYLITHSSISTHFSQILHTTPHRVSVSTIKLKVNGALNADSKFQLLGNIRICFDHFEVSANFNPLGNMNIEYALITLKFHLQHIYGKYVPPGTLSYASIRIFKSCFHIRPITIHFDVLDLAHY